MKNVKSVTPIKPTFKHNVYLCMQTLTNFPFIEDDFDAITNYELLCKVVEYLNKVIENDNKQNESILALYNAFVELKDYVDNYFDNLDVQDEINNKLDDMLEQGTLQTIIEEFIQTNALWTFDNIAELKLATNLISGNYAKTLGFYSVGDGGDGIYKIRELEENETANEMDIISLSDNTLVAELVINNEINIRSLGAKGDDTTDDTNFIERAVELANSNKVTLKIPKGNFKIADAFDIYDDMTIIGSGNNSVIHQTAESKNIFQCFTSINNLLIKDLYLYGVVAPDTPTEQERGCLILCGCTNSKFINLKLGTSDDSHISLRYSVNDNNTLNLSDNNIIENCEFTNCTEGSPVELFFATNTTINNCYFHDNNIDNTRWSVRMLQAVNTIITNCKFKNEYIAIWHANGIGGNGLYPKIQSNNLLVDSCIFEGNRHGDIILKGSNEIISNCKFKCANVSGITAIQMNYQNTDELIDTVCVNRKITNNIISDYSICMAINDYNENVDISNNYMTNKSSLTYDRVVGIQITSILHCKKININNNIIETYDKKLNLTRTQTIDDESNKYGTIMNNILYTGGGASAHPLLYSVNNNYYIDGNINNYASVSD